MALVTNNISGSANNSSTIGITGSVIIGNSPGSMFPTKGTDTVFFVSGSDTSRSVFGGTAFISGSLFTNGNVQIGDTSEDTLTINATPVSIPNNLNFDSNTLFIDASNNYVGIGTSSPASPLHIMGAGGWRASSPANASGFEFINVNNSTWRLCPIGTATNLEIYSDVTIPTNGTAGLGFNSLAGQTTDTLLYRSAAGILSLSGSSPGFMFKWIATSTPTVVGQFGMNISSGRPQAFISGTVCQLAHMNELVAGDTGQVQFNNSGVPGASSTLTFSTAGNILTSLNMSATAITASSIIAGDASVNLLNTTATTINFGGAATSLNVGQSTDTNTINIGNANTADTKTQTINIGAGTGVTSGKSVVTIGSSANASALTLQAGASPSALNIESTTGAIYIGNSTYARAIQLGTGLALQNVLIGSQTSASSLTLQAGTGHVVLSGSTTTNYTVGSALGTGTITIGQSTGTNSILIGASGTSTAAAQSINIGGGTGMTSITLGAITGASALTLQAGTGHLVLTGSTTTNYTIGSALGTGTLTLGRSTAANSILIGAAGTNTAVTQAINIGGGSGLTSITLGASTGASSLTLQAGTGDINIGAGGGARTTNIATTSVGTQTINIGTFSSNAAIIRIGNYNSSPTPSTTAIYGDTIAIGTSSAAAKVGIGNSTPVSKLDVTTDEAGWAVSILNDGNNANRFGLFIQNGSDTAAGTNYAIGIHDGDSTNVGYITFSGATVTYGAFTGDHYAKITDLNTEKAYGIIVKIVNTTTIPLGSKRVDYIVAQTTTAKDSAVFGVYSGNFENAPDESMKDYHSIFCLGDGHILVTDDGGNINIGDYICSSNKPGHGMTQDDDILHNYTVAKASAPVDFSNIPNDPIKGFKSVLVACTYHSA